MEFAIPAPASSSTPESFSLLGKPFDILLCAFLVPGFGLLISLILLLLLSVLGFLVGSIRSANLRAEDSGYVDLVAAFLSRSLRRAGFMRM